jgi:hypothetical protein
MTLDEARTHIGAGVVYNPRPGTYDSAEDGEITGTSDAYVFVLYVGDRSPKATRAEDLTLLGGAR